MPRNCVRLVLYLTRARSLFTTESTWFLANSRLPRFIPMDSSFNPPITSFAVVRLCTCGRIVFSLCIMLFALDGVPLAFFCLLLAPLPTPSSLWDLSLQRWLLSECDDSSPSPLESPFYPLYFEALFCAIIFYWMCRWLVLAFVGTFNLLWTSIVFVRKRLFCVLVVVCLCKPPS